jgi:hypothetical protein
MLKKTLVTGFVTLALVAAATGHVLVLGYALAVLTLAGIVGLMAWGLIEMFSWRLNYRRRVLGWGSPATPAPPAVGDRGESPRAA